MFKSSLLWVIFVHLVLIGYRNFCYAICINAFVLFPYRQKNNFLSVLYSFKSLDCLYAVISDKPNDFTIVKIMKKQ